MGSSSLNLLRGFVKTEQFEAAKKVAVTMLDRAQVGISNHRVGCGLIARRPPLGENWWGIFSGCNIELATSKVWHAEETALIEAIKAGYTIPQLIVVTSDHGDQQAAMCGYCMQHYQYASHPELDPMIVVLNPDNDSIKLVTTLARRNGKYAYLGRGKLNHA